jgi:ABC-type multidrug transport system fused ATPase/permease subunit
MGRRRHQSDIDDKLPPVKLSKESFKEGLKIFSYIKPYKWQFIIGLILLAISSVIFLGVMEVAGEMVDVATGEAGDFWTLNTIGVTLFIVFILQGVISFFRIYLFAIVSENGTAAIRTDLYSRMITLPVSFFEKSRVGELVSRITADVERMYNVFSIVLAEFVRQIIMLVGGIIFILFKAPKLAIIMLATFPIVVVGAVFFGKHIRKLSKKRQKALADSNVIMNETVTNIQSVKSFTNEEYESNRYGGSITNVVDIALTYAKSRGIFAAFIVTVFTGAIIFVFWYGAKMIQTGELTAGDLVTFTGITGVIGAAIAGLGNFYTELIGALGATERVREIIGSVPELENQDNGKRHNMYGKVSFKDVKFTYPTRPDITVLKGLSLDIEPEKKIALVGTSGSGKSTVMALLLRLYNLDAGDIHIDDTNVLDYDLQAYRRNFSIVPQDAILFGGTIRENIQYGRLDASEEDIIVAAKQSNSWEFIESFPEGLDTLVGDRGIKLSGGQRQRIAIARAILKNPSILLLDEATSALDSESEKIVQDALDKLMEGRTSIIIAHRLSTIKDVDMIYVLEDGQIIEKGNHDDLMAIPKGRYKSQVELSTLE